MQHRVAKAPVARRESVPQQNLTLPFHPPPRPLTISSTPGSALSLGVATAITAPNIIAHHPRIIFFVSRLLLEEPNLGCGRRPRCEKWPSSFHNARASRWIKSL